LVPPSARPRRGPGAPPIHAFNGRGLFPEGFLFMFFCDPAPPGIGPHGPPPLWIPWCSFFSAPTNLGPAFIFPPNPRPPFLAGAPSPPGGVPHFFPNQSQKIIWGKTTPHPGGPPSRGAPFGPEWSPAKVVPWVARPPAPPLPNLVSFEKQSGPLPKFPPPRFFFFLSHGPPRPPLAVFWLRPPVFFPPRPYFFLLFRSPLMFFPFAIFFFIFVFFVPEKCPPPPPLFLKGSFVD